MASVLVGVPCQQCLVHLDDSLIHGESYEEALDSLQLVLGKVAAAGLYHDKFHFLWREVEFLPWVLGCECIGMLEDQCHYRLAHRSSPDSTEEFSGPGLLQEVYLGVLVNCCRRVVRWTGAQSVRRHLTHFARLSRKHMSTLHLIPLPTPVWRCRAWHWQDVVRVEQLVLLLHCFYCWT